MNAQAVATNGRGSCIAGSHPVYEPAVKVEQTYATRMNDILSPLVAKGLLTDVDVHLLVKLGPDSLTFSQTIGGVKSSREISAAQVDHLEYISEIASLAYNGVISPLEFRQALNAGPSVRQETLDTINNLLVLKGAFAQLANAQGGEYKPIVSEQGLVADVHRLMTPEMAATLKKLQTPATV